MKNLKDIAFLSLIILTSCKSNYGDLTDKENICKLYEQMDSDDQKYRTIIPTDGFFEILDSIKNSEGITRDIYASFPIEKQREYGKRAKLIASKRPVDHVKSDSLMKLQKVVDNENTELLMKIIKKNKGVPDIKTLPCKRGYGAVFMHSDEKYFPELRILFENEYKAGRVQDAEYNYMQWHFGGRKFNENSSIKITN